MQTLRNIKYFVVFCLIVYLAWLGANSYFNPLAQFTAEVKSNGNQTGHFSAEKTN
jgi:hypothetical protein